MSRLEHYICPKDIKNKALTYKEAVKIHDALERQFALFLLSLNHYIVIHEPFWVKAVNPQTAKEEVTLPDFLIINKNHQNGQLEGVLVETTTQTTDIARRGGRKQKQERVLDASGLRWTMLGREHFQRIDEKHPEAHLMRPTGRHKLIFDKYYE